MEETLERTNFIWEAIDQDLESGRYQQIHTRFPPEPNGYMHIGHCKALIMDFLTADRQVLLSMRSGDRTRSGFPASVLFHQPGFDRSIRDSAAGSPCAAEGEIVRSVSLNGLTNADSST